MNNKNKTLYLILLILSFTLLADTEILRPNGVGNSTNFSQYPAIEVDTISTGTGTTSPITVSHTTSGTNRLMLVGISGRASTGSYMTVSSVTYNGVDLSLVGVQNGNNYTRIYIYSLIAPDTGTYNVVVTGSWSNGGIVGVMTYTGVDQDIPLGTFAGAGGSSSTASVDVSSAVGELVMDVICPGEGSATVGAGQTERWNLTSSYIDGAGSTEPGATTVTMSWTSTYSWALGAVPIKPAGKNYDKVDEETHDDNTTYVHADGDVLRDTYAMQNHTTGSGKINKVTVYFWAAREGATFCGFNPVMRTHDTDYLASYITVNNTEPTYAEFTQEYTTNPFTGEAWTWDEIDAMECGQENYHHSTWGTGYLRITQVYAVVEYTKQVYYSVGTSTADLKNASNISISSGTATFTVGQPDNVGVGDVIDYSALSKGAPTTATAYHTQTLTIPNHTVSGSNTLLLVGIGWEPDEYETISSVYWNGTEQLTEVVYANQDDDAASAIYKLVNPTATTANIVVTFNTNLSHYAAAGAITFTGVDQTTPTGTPNSLTGDLDNPSLSVPSDIGDIIFGVTSVEDRTIIGIGSGQTDEWTYNDLLDAGLYSPSTGATSKDGAATSTTISWTYSGQDWTASVGVAVKPASTTSQYAYISGRTSSTEYSVVTEKGAIPADGSGTVNSIRRVFNSLSDAEINSPGLSYLNTSDLVTGNYQLNWVCYNDAEMTNTVIIYGYTTGVDNYIKIYTPVDTPEVGTSQRHNGTAWTTNGFRVSGSPVSDGQVIGIREDYVRVEGLQVRVATANSGVDGIKVDCNYVNNISDVRISNNIITAQASTGTDAAGIGVWAPSSGGNDPTAKIWNNIIYNFDGSSNYGIYVGLNSYPTVYFYNNTVSDNIYGLFQETGTIVAKNNASLGNNDNYSGTFDATSTNNASSGTDAPGSNPLNSVTAANNFVSTTSGSEDFHLKYGADCIEAGADLDEDSYIAVTDDIDGESRDSSTPDIGADEFVFFPPTTPTLIRIFDNAIFNAYPSYKCTLSVVSTDPDEDDIEYEIQWDTDPDFGSASSNTIGPYASGFTVTTTILLGGTPAEAETLFYWKARARDPGGLNEWSDWSNRRSFTMDMELENGYPYWYQVEGQQFEQGTKNGVTIQGDSVVFSSTGASISETGSATNTGSSSAVSITHGLTINAGDVIIAIVHANSNPSITDNNGAYSFIEQLEEANPGQSSQYAIYYRVAGASEPSDYAWTLSSLQSWSIQIRVFSGVDNSSVWDVIPSASTRGYGVGAIATAPTMTTSNDGAMGIVALVSDALYVNFNNPSNGYGTEVEPASSRAQASYIREWATAGSTGETTVALTSNDWLAHQFALKPGTTTEGTLISPAVAYTDLTTENPSRSHWDGAKWMKSSADDSIGLQIEYKSGGTWSLVPDGDLPNNSTGIFDQDSAFCTVDLSSLNTTTYDSLRMKAIFRSYTAKSASVPALEMWALGNLGGITGVSPTNNPTIFALSRNRPNPFTNGTEIRYQIPKRVKVNLQVFDIMGRSVTTLVNKEQKPGYYSIQWRGTNKNGRPLPSGIYFLRMEAGDFKATQKMVRLR